MSIDLASIGKFVAFGYTFSTHVEDPDREPAFWIQPPSSLIPEEEPVVVPSGIDEVSLGPEPTVVVSDRLWRASRDEVADAIGGVTISNDVSASESLPASIPESHDFAMDPPDQIYKFAPTFRPVLTEPVDLGADDLDDLAVEAYVDGERVSAGSTADMRFDPLALVSEVSRYVPLEPGDLIALGEPHSPIVDDECEVACRVEGVGELANPVVWG